ncbi:MAG: hypothetical protein ACSHXY_08360 [Alphaproteobacteria bacterium]
MPCLRYLALIFASLWIFTSVGQAQTLNQQPIRPITNDALKQKAPQENVSVDLVAKRLEAQRQKKEALCKSLEPKIDTWWHPAFDWSMPARYGHDRKLYDGDNGVKVGNGIIDLPNTRDYIMNTKSYSNNANDACPCSGSQCVPKFRVNLFIDQRGNRNAGYTGVASSIRHQRMKNGCSVIDFPDAPEPSYVWKVDRPSKPFQASGANASVCLPEGTHNVTFKVNYRVNGILSSREVTRPIEVIDHLIVNLGDSYGAGEGAPETNFLPQRMEKIVHGGGDNSASKQSLKTVNWKTQFMDPGLPFYAQWADSGTTIPTVKSSHIQRYKDKPKVYAFSELKADTYYDIDGTYYTKDNIPWANDTLRDLWLHYETDFAWGLFTDHTGQTQRALLRQNFPNAKVINVLSSEWDKSTYRKVVEDDWFMPDWDAIKPGRNQTYKTLMDHHHAHRSSAAAASQLALHLESHDTKSSVTFINLAASGATMQTGLLAPYNGVGELRGKGAGPYLPRHNGQLGLRPQVDEMKALVGNRTIDDIYLSVGGNDVGFANMIAVFLAAWDWDSEKAWFDILEDDEVGGNVGKMMEYFETGQWSKGIYSGLAGTLGAFAFMDDITGLDRLGDDYEALQSQFRGLDISGKVNLVGYPNFSSATRDDGNTEIKTPYPHGTYYCDINIKENEDPTLGARLDFDPVEFKVVHHKIFTELSKKMEESAKSQSGPEWAFLPQGVEPRQHGICGWGQYHNDDYRSIYGHYQRSNKKDENNQKPGTFLTNSRGDSLGAKWYRTPQDGAIIQKGEAVTNKGLFHPNEFGYRHAGRVMMKNLEPYGAELAAARGLPELHHDDEGVDRFSDPDDSIAEATENLGGGGGEAEGVLTGLSDVKMFRFTGRGERCEPRTLRMTHQSHEGPLTIKVYGSNGELLASSNSRAPLQGLGSNTKDLSAISTPSTILTVPSRGARLGSLMATGDQGEQNGADFCGTAEYSSVPDSYEDGTESRVSFLREHRHHIYVAVSHQDNKRYDPVTGRGDARSDKTKSNVSFKVSVIAESASE